MASAVKITSPLQGDILNRHDGIEEGGRLLIGVFGEAPEAAQVRVNGEVAEREGKLFRAKAALTETQTALVAELADGSARDTATVLWDQGSRKRYRFSLDDNILFLRDIAQDPAAHPSLFDHWYLAFWRRMHQEYGTKVHINLYYQDVEHTFNLSQFPERYKDEWQANADWLRLSFHALQDKPDRIYKDATYQQMARDFELVMEEIYRFAGREVTSAFTTVHWAEAPREACRALRERGIEGLLGLFVTSAPDASFTRYYLPKELGGHIAEREAWKDLEEDMVFISCDAVVNGLALAEIVPYLDEVELNLHRLDMMELLIHEQYFRQELFYHQPDVFEKVEAAIEWVAERGYEPTFWQEGLLEGLRSED